MNERNLVPMNMAVANQQSGQTSDGGRAILTGAVIVGTWLTGAAAFWGGYRVAKKMYAADPEQRPKSKQDKAILIGTSVAPAVVLAAVTTVGNVACYNISNQQIALAATSGYILKNEAEKKIEAHQQKKLGEQQRTTANNTNVTAGDAKTATHDDSEFNELRADDKPESVVRTWNDPWNERYFKASEAQIVVAINKAVQNIDTFQVAKQLTLNDIFENIGLPRTQSCEVIGWMEQLDNGYDIARCCQLDLIPAWTTMEKPDGTKEPCRILQFEVEPNVFYD